MWRTTEIRGIYPKSGNSSASLEKQVNKGTVSRDFLLQVFSWIIFPQAPDNKIRVISNFSENSRRYSFVKVHQIWPPVLLVSLIEVANNWTISDCLHLRVSLMFTQLPKGVQQKVKLFWFKFFFHFPPVSTTPMVHLERRIFPQIFEQILNGLNSVLMGMWETESQKKTWCWKSRDIVPLNNIHLLQSHFKIKFSDLPLEVF